MVNRYWLKGYFLDVRLTDEGLVKLYYLDGFFIKERPTTKEKINKLLSLIMYYKNGK